MHGIPSSILAFQAKSGLVTVLSLSPALKSRRRKLAALLPETTQFIVVVSLFQTILSLPLVPFGKRIAFVSLVPHDYKLSTRVVLASHELTLLSMRAELQRTAFRLNTPRLLQ